MHTLPRCGLIFSFQMPYFLHWLFSSTLLTQLKPPEASEQAAKKVEGAALELPPGLTRPGPCEPEFWKNDLPANLFLLRTLWFRRGFLAGKCNAGRVFFTHSKLSILRCECKLLLSPFVLASQNMRILAEFKLGEIRDRKTGKCLLRLDLSASNCYLNFSFTKNTYNGLLSNDKSLSQWCFLKIIFIHALKLQ